MRFLPRCPRPRAAVLRTLLVTLTAFAAAGCGGPCTRQAAVPSGKDGPPPVAARRQSEFDFYCTLRPAPATAGSVAGPRPFAPAVYEAMKARGYQVHLLLYRYERSADGFGSYGGYGFRNFFGAGEDARSGGRKVLKGQRAAVVWETRRGEFFLVDRYYATPLWLEGATWLEKVRFYDPAAVSVEVAKS